MLAHGCPGFGNGDQEVCHCPTACQNYSRFRRWLETTGILFGGMQASSAFAGNGWER